MPKREKGTNIFQVSADMLSRMFKKEEKYINSEEFWNNVEDITNGMTVKVWFK